jgi:hypothetical protein
VSVVPTRSRDVECLSWSTSASVTASISSMSCLASTTTSAVISLVSDAIGMTATGFFSNSTSPVSGSRISTALDLSAAGLSACTVATRGCARARGRVTRTAAALAFLFTRLRACRLRTTFFCETVTSLPARTTFAFWRPSTACACDGENTPAAATNTINPANLNIFLDPIK